jgi:hypothetical protein
MCNQVPVCYLLTISNTLPCGTTFAAVCGSSPWQTPGTATMLAKVWGAAFNFLFKSM